MYIHFPYINISWPDVPRRIEGYQTRFFEVKCFQKETRTKDWCNPICCSLYGFKPYKLYVYVIMLRISICVLCIVYKILFLCICYVYTLCYVYVCYYVYKVYVVYMVLKVYVFPKCVITPFLKHKSN